MILDKDKLYDGVLEAITKGIETTDVNDTDVEVKYSEGDVAGLFDYEGSRGWSVSGKQ